MNSLRKAVQVFKVAVLLFPFSLFLAALPTAWHAQRQSNAKSQPQARSASPAADQKRLAAVFASQPASFEPNRGQSDPSVKFLSRGPGYALFLTREEAVLSLPSPAAPSSRSISEQAFRALRLKILNANRSSQIEGLELLPQRSNYFLGNNSSQQQAGVPNFAQVRYRSVYPGIDLVFHGDANRLEFDLDVAPGADVRRARFQLDGADSVQLEASGDLIASYHSAELRLHRPVSYQHTARGVRPVSGQFTLSSKNEIGFQMGDYDASLPLVIDPVLFYSTFLGGTGADQAFGVAVDSQGNFYATGQTASSNFPVTGAFQGSIGGLTDAFVAKFNADGSGLVYCTYLGGSFPDIAQGIAVDANGSAYVAGFTTSTNFPTKNPLQAALKGQQDIFVTKLSPDGASLVFSTYLGGSALDTIAAIALDAQNDVVLAGTTKSTDFPLVNALESSLHGTAGDSDAFVAKISADGSHLIFSTYLGGASVDGATGVAVDSQGNIVVSGGTNSTDFPVLNAVQATFADGPNNGAVTSEAFLTKLADDGSAILFSTYWGGTGSEQGTSVSLDASDNIFLVGETTSTDFPTLNAVEPRSANGGAQITGFITKFKSDGSATFFSTYFGGTGSETIFGSAVDPNGNIYVSGNTTSADLPVTNAIQSTYGGGASDGFVSELSANGSSLLFSTYLGGSGTDGFNRMAADSNGIYLAGSTSAADFPTAGTQVDAFMGGTDGVVVKIASVHVAAVMLSTQSLTFGDQSVGTTSSSQPVTLTNTGNSSLTISHVAISSDFGQTNNCGSAVASNASCTFNVTFTPTAAGTRTGTLTITDNASDSPQTVSLTGSGTTASPVAGVSPSTLTFATQLVGTTSTSQTATLSNTGTGSLTISSSSTSGDFSQTNNCGASVAANASCTFTIAFKPTVSGTRTGLLTITDNASGSPQHVALTGSGADFTLGVASGSTTSATVTKGQTASYSLSIAPTGGLSGTVSFTCAGAPSEANCAVMPGSLATNGSTAANVSVSVTTTAASMVSAQVPLPPSGDFSGLGRQPETQIALWMTLLLMGTLALRTTRLFRIRARIWPDLVWRVPRIAHAVAAAVLIALLALTITIGGCANGTAHVPADPGTPTGSYNLTVTATFTSGANTLQRNLTLTLNVQ